MDPGVNEATIEFATARNLLQLLEHAGQGFSAGYDSGLGILKTDCACFLKGMHCRMGDTYHPNLRISIKIMVELMK